MDRATRRSELMAALKDLRLATLFERKAEWRALCDAAFRQVLAELGVPADRIEAIEGIDARAPQSAETIEVICTDGDEATLVERARARGATAVGLFADLLPRLLASAPPRFRPGQAADPARRYAIVSLPRSGSTVLAQELERIGAGRPREHIRPSLLEFVRHADLTGFKLKRWWTLLTRSQVANGVFGTKIIWGFLTALMEALSRSERAWLDRELGGCRLFYLRRADKLEQAASDYVARATRVWHLWERNADYEERLGRIDDIDYDDVRRTWQKLQSGEEELARYLAGLGADVRPVEFDDVCVDPAAQACAIAAQLSLEAGAPPPSRSKPTLRRTQSRLHDAIVAKLRPELG